jgi:hypothetical protein
VLSSACLDLVIDTIGREKNIAQDTRKDKRHGMFPGVEGPVEGVCLGADGESRGDGEVWSSVGEMIAKRTRNRWLEIGGARPEITPLSWQIQRCRPLDPEFGNNLTSEQLAHLDPEADKPQILGM